MGAKAYKLFRCYSLFLERGQNVVEIGSERREGSTTFFHRFCEKKGFNFSTVDIDPEIYENATAIVGESAHLQDGKEFLKSFPEKIGFAYLDNFDWDWGDIQHLITKQKVRYRELNFELNNANSQQQHLEQAKNVNSKAGDPCFILFDDTYFDNKTEKWTGKGGRAIEFLLKNNFRILENKPEADKHKQYVLLGRGKMRKTLKWKVSYFLYNMEQMLTTFWKRFKNRIGGVLKKFLPDSIYIPLRTLARHI